METDREKNSFGIAEDVLSILRCPSCAAPVRAVPEGLVCLICKKIFPRVRGVIRFVDQQAYTGSFGFEWNKYDRTQLDTGTDRRSERDFIAKTGLQPQDLAGKLVLDVGCGMGRYAEVVTRWGARVVGIDLSQAVEAAQRNMAGRNAVILQADAFCLPFAPESFDYIYSLGVLHHTPDCEQAVKRLPILLKPNGGMAIWLYSAYNPWYRCSDIYRRVTRRLPPRLLHSLCYGVLPLYWVHKGLRKIPLFGRTVSAVLRYVIPMSFNQDSQVRVLDTFDWYSPWYQSKHTYEQVFRWLESCGMKDLHVGEVPISVRARKPEPAVEPHTSENIPEVPSCAE